MSAALKIERAVILAAFRVEVERLPERLEGKSALEEAGFLKYVTGEFEGRAVLVGTSGMGKVRAAAAAQKAVDLFQPGILLCCGTAGALREGVVPLDLVLGEKVLQHDTVPEVSSWIEADPSMTGRLEQAAQDVVKGTPHALHRGGLVTGDRPVLDAGERKELARRFDALAVDMEAAAVVQVALENGVPAAVIKAVTDSADEHGKSDFKKNVKKGAGLAQQAVLALLTQAAR
ncbi:MAG: 5'-methylthioadenosine/S-adenosylhomocysteine nucleosidase [Planctomycetota bacterium]|jgi:adenosylhomocysteine nucleosidase